MIKAIKKVRNIIKIILIYHQIKKKINMIIIIQTQTQTFQIII